MMFDFSTWKYLFIIANILKGTGLLVVGIILIRVWFQKRKITDAWILFCFASFILSSAMGRYIETSLVYYPLEKLYIIFLLMAGFFAIITAFLLPGVVHRKLKLLSIEEYEHLIYSLQKEKEHLDEAVEELTIINENLQERIYELEKMKERGIWFKEQEKLLNDLRNLVKETNNVKNT